jgi:cysteine desulfuration protein SufE
MKNFQEKIKKIKSFFANCSTPDETYDAIMELGKTLPPLLKNHQIEENRIQGCQSTTYIHTTYKDGLLFFEADSDALISKGLAALLILVYSGESPEIILKSPPIYLKELGISNSLSPNRATGMNDMWQRIQKDALTALTKN